MAYDETVAQRVRGVLAKSAGITEMKMFGGIAFLVHGNMCCGVLGDRLMVRVGPEGEKAALSQPHARAMDFTGKPLEGFVFVGPEGFSSDRDLAVWVSKGMGYARSLPPK